MKKKYRERATSRGSRVYERRDEIERCKLERERDASETERPTERERDIS